RTQRVARSDRSRRHVVRAYELIGVGVRARSARRTHSRGARSPRSAPVSFCSRAPARADIGDVKGAAPGAARTVRIASAQGGRARGRDRGREPSQSRRKNRCVEPRKGGFRPFVLVPFEGPGSGWFPGLFL